MVGGEFQQCVYSRPRWYTKHIYYFLHFDPPLSSVFTFFANLIYGYLFYKRDDNKWQGCRGVKPGGSSLRCYIKKHKTKHNSKEEN